MPFTITTITTNLEGLAVREGDLLREFLTDALGAASPTSVAARGISKGVEYTSHLPPLAFPTAMGSLPQPSSFCVGLAMGVGMI